MPSIKTNDANFYYESHGRGYPLILIAGYTCDHTFWIPILDALSKNFQVIIFDNRSIGQTTDNNQPLTTDLMAKDVISLADELKLNKPHIIGHSMGGSIAQAIGAFYPEKISKLGILNSSPKWREASHQALRSMLTMREKNIDFDLIFETMLPWIFGEKFLKNARAIQLLKNSYLQNKYPQSLADQTRQFNFLEQFDSRELIKKINAQTLIIHGTQDLLSLPSDSIFIASRIHDSKSVELDCAHSSVLEVPEPLIKILNEFLA